MLDIIAELQAAEYPSRLSESAVLVLLEALVFVYSETERCKTSWRMDFSSLLGRQ